MSLWEFKIENNSESSKDGYFPASIHGENGLVIPFYNHSSMSSYIKENDTIKFFFNDKELVLTEAINKQLVLYFSYSRLLDLNSEFTCHQFATFLKGYPYDSSNINHTPLATRRSLIVGDLIILKGPSSNDELHSAIYLGEELYLSTFGHSNFMITSLDAMLRRYSKTNLITVIHEIYPHNGVKKLDRLSYVHKAFVSPSQYRSAGLCYALLNLSFGQILDGNHDMDIIKQAYKKGAIKYHSDKGNSDPTAFHIVQTIYELLGDPLIRSSYHALLREGGDWTLTSIFPHLSQKENIISYFKNAINILESNQKQAFIHTIKTEPLYQSVYEQAKAKPSNKTDVTLNIAENINSTSRSHDTIPYYPTEIQFDDQERQLEWGSQPFYRNDSTRIGEIKINYEPHSITQLIPFEEVATGDFSSENAQFLKSHAIDAKQLKIVIQHLRVCLNLPVESRTLIANQDYIPSSYSLVQCSNEQGQGIAIGVYLGTNLFLFNVKNQNNFIIINTIGLQANNITTVYEIIEEGNADASLNTILASVQRTKEMSLFPFMYFYNLKSNLNERLKALFLNFPIMDKANFSLPHYLYNEVCDKPVIINNDFYHSACFNLPIGVTLIFTEYNSFTKQSGIKLMGVHLGRNKLLVHFNKSLFTMDILGVVEACAGITQIIVAHAEATISTDNITYNTVPYATMRKMVNNETIEVPLLYALLNIPCNPLQLSKVKTTDITKAFNNRMVEIENDLYFSEKSSLLQRAYHLLMNFDFRVQYGIKYRTDNPISFEKLMKLKNASKTQKISIYKCAIALLENRTKFETSLKENWEYLNLIGQFKSKLENMLKQNSHYHAEKPHDNVKELFLKYKIDKSNNTKEKINFFIRENSGINRWIAVTRIKQQASISSLNTTLTYQDVFDSFPWVKEHINFLLRTAKSVGYDIKIEELHNNQINTLFDLVWDDLINSEEKEEIENIYINFFKQKTQERFVSVCGNEHHLLIKEDGSIEMSLNHDALSYVHLKDTLSKFTKKSTTLDNNTCLQLDMHFYVFNNLLQFIKLTNTLNAELVELNLNPTYILQRTSETGPDYYTISVRFSGNSKNKMLFAHIESFCKNSSHFHCNRKSSRFSYNNHNNGYINNYNNVAAADWNGATDSLSEQQFSLFIDKLKTFSQAEASYTIPLFEPCLHLTNIPHSQEKTVWTKIMHRSDNKDSSDDLLDALDKKFEATRAETNENVDKMTDEIKNEGRKVLKERDKNVVNLMSNLRSDLEQQVSLLRSMKANNTSATDYSSLLSKTDELQKLCLNVFVTLNEEKHSEIPIDEIQRSLAECKELIITTINKKAGYHRNRYFSTTGKSLSILNELTNTVHLLQQHVADIRGYYMPVRQLL